MPSSYLRRVEAIEAVLGPAACPRERCGRCLVRGLMAGLGRERAPACDARPGTMFDELQGLTFEERDQLKAVVDAERERRKRAVIPTK